MPRLHCLKAQKTGGLGEFMYHVLREAAQKVGIKKIGERTSLLWKLSEKMGAGETYFNEN